MKFKQHWVNWSYYQLLIPDLGHWAFASRSSRERWNQGISSSPQGARICPNVVVIYLDTKTLPVRLVLIQIWILELFQLWILDLIQTLIDRIHWNSLQVLVEEINAYILVPVLRKAGSRAKNPHTLGCTSIFSATKVHVNELFAHCFASSMFLRKPKLWLRSHRRQKWPESVPDSANSTSHIVSDRFHFDSWHFQMCYGTGSSWTWLVWIALLDYSRLNWASRPAVRA